ncbi:MAG: putative structural protein [Prokaryotic dsDNA virus sp.]|nr:MAG: putative structural protein [Prokaryotic dsDNA virus sp.]|tara:strand:+ start:464 stop:877 length:414 start_codon:yes stop_codon:yes gene_type:complete
MALQNYGTDSFVLSINSRVITDFGETASPFQDAPINPASQLRQGLGGGAVRLDRIKPGRTVQLYLNPGSADSAYLQSLFTARTEVTLSYQQVGTLESAVGTEGVVTNDAANNRAGSTISDDQYTLEFNGWNAMKGGA